MKYGVPIDKHKIPDFNSAREFTDEHWANIQKTIPSYWIPYPKKKVFISFCEADRNRMKNLKKAILKFELIEPVIVEDKREGAKDLSELVIKSIEESDYFITIISENSINSQWVNQELGFAKAREKKIEIIPLIQDTAFNNLKGFIHKNMQLAYKFSIHNNAKKDRKSFRNAYKEVVNYIECQVLKSIIKI